MSYLALKRWEPKGQKKYRNSRTRRFDFVNRVNLARVKIKGRCESEMFQLSKSNQILLSGK